MEVISRSIRGPGTLLGLGWDSGYLWGVTVMLLTSMGLGLSLSRVGVSTPAGPGVSRLVPDVRDILDTAAGVTGLFPNVISSRDILLSSAAASLIVSSLSSGSSTMVSSLVMVSSSTSLTTSGSQGLGMGLSGLKAELSPTRKGFSETQVWSL